MDVATVIGVETLDLDLFYSSKSLQERISFRLQGPHVVSPSPCREPRQWISIFLRNLKMVIEATVDPRAGGDGTLAKAAVIIMAFSKARRST